MFKQIKTLFSSNDRQKFSEAEAKFDALMSELDKDQIDLEDLARHVEGEFDDIQDDVEEMTRKVDELTVKSSK